MDNSTSVGKKIIDISKLVDVFEAQEGEIQHIIGKTGNGKTYEGTRRALEYLKNGYTVYTTWQMILPEFYDEREDRFKVFLGTLFFRKTFYKFDFKNNWHFLDIEMDNLVEFVAGLTDCIVFLDEGQDIFDSYEGTGMSKIKRKSLTRTRHLRKTLIIISQRAQAVAVTARANVTYYYKCVKGRAWWWPFKAYFKVYRTEEMDNQNLPIWEDIPNEWEAELWQSHFADQKIYDAFNSWYLRAGIPKSQEVKFEAYELNFFDKLKMLFRKKQKVIIAPSQEDLKELERKNLETHIRVTTKQKRPRKALKDVLTKTGPDMVQLENEKDPSVEETKVQETPRKLLVKKQT